MGWFRRLRNTFRPDSVDDAIDEELRFHLEQRQRGLERAGLPPAEAARVARERLGSVSRIKDRVHDVDALPSLDALRQDVAFASRTLLRSGGFLLAVLSLGISVGAVSAVSSTADWLLNRPPAGVSAPDRLVTLQVTERGRTDLIRDGFGMSIPQYTALRDIQNVFTDVAAYGKLIGVVATDTRTDQLVMEFATGSYLALLGVRPVLGRLLTPEDDVPGAPPAAVLSYDFWTSHFGADPEVLDDTLLLNGVTTRVVGVLPEGFSGYMLDWAGTSSLWLPMQAADTLGFGGLLTGTQVTFFRIVGRMRPGVTAATVRERMEAWLPQLPRIQQPFLDANEPVVLTTTDTRVFGPGRARTQQFLTLLLGVCSLVLLAACFNLGNVLLGRAVLRRHEFAVRRALGISQGRLVRLLATETTLVGLMAAAVGLGVGVVVAKALAALPQFYLGLATLTTPFDSSASLDLRFFGGTLALGVLLSLLFGLVPLLLHLRRQSLEALRGRSSRWGLAQLRFPARQGILALQIALSVALAITAGLYARSFLEATRVTTPYDAPESILVARVRPGGMNAEAREAFFASLEDRLERHPEVLASAMAASPPYQAGINVVRHPGSDVRVPIQHKLVGPDYFVTTGIPIVEGRGFEGTEAEVTGGILVNRELASRLWPGESPLGRTLVFGEEVRQVQGVVGDEHCADLHAPAYPCAWRLSAPYATTGYVYVRTAGDPMVFAGTLRQMVRELTPDVAVADEASLDLSLARLLQPERVSAALTALLALLGVVLMAIGSAALFLSMVRERRRELSIRMALGATGGAIARAVLGRGAIVLGLGSAIGLAVAYAVSKRLADQLVGIAPTDAVAFVVVPLVVGAAGLSAVGVAARAAARTSPSRHLASE